MFTDGMKKVLLMINPLLFWKPGIQVRFSTHIAGCEARRIVIIDEVQRETGAASSVQANSVLRCRGGWAIAAGIFESWD
jgi:hypothetical protein